MKKLFSIFTILVVLLTLSGCNSHFIEKILNYNKLSNDIANAYCGDWSDENRCSMVIATNKNKFLIDVYWSSSAYESSTWQLEGKYNSKKKYIEYSGIQKVTTYDRENENAQPDITVIDTTGIICLNPDNTLYWRDQVTGETNTLKRFSYANDDISESVTISAPTISDNYQTSSKNSTSSKDNVSHKPETSNNTSISSKVETQSSKPETSSIISTSSKIEYSSTVQTSSSPTPLSPEEAHKELFVGKWQGASSTMWISYIESISKYKIRVTWDNFMEENSITSWDMYGTMAEGNKIICSERTKYFSKDNGTAQIIDKGGISELRVEGNSLYWDDKDSEDFDNNRQELKNYLFIKSN